MLCDVWFEALVFAVAVLSGGIASVAGFGIGSLLTPTFALAMPMKLAVAAVSVPHLVATAYRCWIMREHIDRRVLKSFGLMSAAGGLLGALLNSFTSSPVLGLVLGGLLLFVGVSGLSGFSQKMKFEGKAAWAAGAVSGFLGGLVGNQGGLRSGAMLGLDVSRHALVATATATGLIVDLARMPVYGATQHKELLRVLPALGIACVGVLLGTAIGARVLKRVSEKAFRIVVAVLLIGLGLWMVGSSGMSLVSSA